jgi:hypothetical protein
VGYISNKEVQQSDLQGFVAGGLMMLFPSWIAIYLPRYSAFACLRSRVRVYEGAVSWWGFDGSIPHQAQLLTRQNTVRVLSAALCKSFPAFIRPLSLEASWAAQL